MSLEPSYLNSQITPDAAPFDFSLSIADPNVSNMELARRYQQANLTQSRENAFGASTLQRAEKNYTSSLIDFPPMVQDLNVRPRRNEETRETLSNSSNPPELKQMWEEFLARYKIPESTKTNHSPPEQRQKEWWECCCIIEGIKALLCIGGKPKSDDEKGQNGLSDRYAEPINDQADQCFKCGMLALVVVGIVIPILQNLWLCCAIPSKRHSCLAVA